VIFLSKREPKTHITNILSKWWNDKGKIEKKYIFEEKGSKM